MSKIMIVEDEMATVKLLKFMLEKKGYTVVHAENGRVAVDNVLDEKPDLILMDVMMPEMDGIQATKIIREDAKTCHIPIIMISALGQELEVTNGLLAGADSYVVKPFDSQALLRLIAEKIS